MEHINVKNLGNGMVKLIPDNGYMLYDDRTQKQYSEAVVKESDVRHFSAVKI
jgi:hypothetical protein